MATEFLQFRIGDEYDSDKLWLTYEVGTTEITVTDRRTFSHPQVDQGYKHAMDDVANKLAAILDGES